jgi:hypothetical protein
MKKTLLGVTSLAISFSFLGCVGNTSNLQPKVYTNKNVKYQTYKVIKKDPIDNQKITKKDIKEFVKADAFKFGRIIKSADAVYMHKYTTIRENITADDNYIKGVATIKDNMPLSSRECKITFKKPYNITETANTVNLNVAKKATEITFSPDCYAKTTFGNTYLYMPYQDENKIKELINKLPNPKYLVLKHKEVAKYGVFKSPNPANVINTNIKRKYNKYYVTDWSTYTNKKDGKRYIKLVRRSWFITDIQPLEYTESVRKFLDENNLRLSDFINSLRVKRLDDGTSLYIGTHIDPARNGSKVYYVAFYVYPIMGDGKVHGSKKELNSLIEEFKKVANQ